MDDIIQKYKQQQKKRNIFIIIGSLTFAFALNFVFGNTQTMQNLMGNITQSSTFSSKLISDVFLEQDSSLGNQIFHLKSRGFEDIKSLSVSFAYNDENVSLKSITPLISKSEIIEISNTNGFYTFIIHFQQETNIAPGEKILEVIFEKDDIYEEEHINLINANMTDKSENSYTLSTSGIMF